MMMIFVPHHTIAITGKYTDTRASTLWGHRWKYTEQQANKMKKKKENNIHKSYGKLKKGEKCFRLYTSKVCDKKNKFKCYELSGLVSNFTNPRSLNSNRLKTKEHASL